MAKVNRTIAKKIFSPWSIPGQMFTKFFKADPKIHRMMFAAAYPGMFLMSWARELSTNHPGKCDWTGGRMLGAHRYKRFICASVKSVGGSMVKYRFKATHKGATGQIYPGSDVSVRVVVAPYAHQRETNYSPIDIDEDGYFTLLVDLSKNDHVSRHFNHLGVDDELEVQGPFQTFRYHPDFADDLSVIADSEGLAGALQIAQRISINPDDKTNCKLVVCGTKGQGQMLLDELCEKGKVLVSYHDDFKSKGAQDSLIKSVFPAKDKARALVSGSFPFKQTLLASKDKGNKRELRSKPDAAQFQDSVLGRAGYSLDKVVELPTRSSAYL